MFKIAIVIFREFLEIAILLSVILAATKEVHNRSKYIVLGIMIGCVLASIIAFFTGALASAFGGIGDELFDVSVMVFTVIVIGWTIVWMQEYSSNIKQEMYDVSSKIHSGNVSKFSLTAIIATTFFREASEIILFIYSLTSSSNIEAIDYLMGLFLGTISGVLCGIAIYLGLIRYSGKYIFKICTIMLIFIAAGIASEAAGILTSIGTITFFNDSIWDTSSIIQDSSMLGKVLKIVIGYYSKPNLLQILSYSITLIILFLLNQRKSRPKVL